MWLRSGQSRLRAIPPGRHLPSLHSPLFSHSLRHCSPFSLCCALKLIWNKIKFTLAASRRDRVTQMKLLKLAKWPNGRVANWQTGLCFAYFMLPARATTHATTLTHSAVSVAKISLFRVRGRLWTGSKRSQDARGSSWAAAIHHLSDWLIWDLLAPWRKSVSVHNVTCSWSHF